MRPRSTLRSAWVVALAAAAIALPASCRAPTQVTLVLTTDVPCSDLDGTNVTVGLETDLEDLPPATDTTACDANGRIGSIVVVPSADTEGAFAVRIVAGKGMPVADCVAPAYGPPPPSTIGCIVARRSLRFIPSAPLTLPIDLRDACVGTPCAPGETCVQGACVSAEVDPEACQGPDGCSEEQLAPASPPPDAGADAPADAPVDAPACSDSPCKVVAPQCGCPPGDACEHTGVGTQGCFGAGTSVQPDLCEPGECAPGFTCQGPAGSQTKTCKKYCDTDADCPMPASVCALELKSSLQMSLGFTLCTDGCSALDNSGCPDKTSCSLVFGGAQGDAFMLCLEAGSGVQGDACTEPSSCAPEHFCVNTMTGTLCLEVCDAGDPAAKCPDPTLCQALQSGGEDIVVGGTKYGVCY